ncbi:siderophore iron transporter mirB [Verticillium dahliae VdLs.17]|uniref:Siderophore iron transporter mirB n=2 Tax=Verticillium dahliae TaxID=27337 RepID=G2XDK3_VERDV|nr:siderophore iron transporter mirB [Verticillium dahliae VdLs.17]EGY17071.1 siderophore iron transporter mirB [Verticillium dahliae VdLs.17]KAF3347730.1 Meiotic recombination protein rec14 [Verticillium dahliae VDG2]KAH6696049.1 siderophore iron transporter mirB [Verticillium dahliae]
MPTLPKIRLGLGRQQVDDVIVPAAAEGTPDDAKLGAENVANETGAQVDEKPVLPSENVQHGVQSVQAVTLTWSKRSLVAVFINIWCLYLVNAFQSSILYNLMPFVTSDFESHSLLTVINIVANAMTAAVYIPLAKMLDVWGRAEGFLVMTSFATLGLVLMATCNSFSTFCAAQVFYSIGFGGIIYSVDVITADATSLKNRGLAFAFTSSPYMITAFAGPKAAEGFYENVNWRWGFGCFSIILPCVAAPLFTILKFNLRKAEQQGRILREKSGRTVAQNIWMFVTEFDVPGVILFAGGLTTFLLPFTLADSAPNGWSSGYIIAMIVVGFVVLGIFALYETFLAPTPFLNNSYFTSFLQVVNNLSVSEAGYVASTFDVVSGILLLIVGFSIRKTGYFKWLLYFAIPLYVFAQGLMIHFRQPNGYIGYIFMCQIFISVGGSIFIIVQQLSILAAVDHQHVAAALALLSVVGNIGGAVGNSISGAIWTNTFAEALERYLPATALPDLTEIYESLEMQLSYEVGSPERFGIQQAYGYAQTKMLATGTGIMALSFIWVLLIRNINVGTIKQTMGNVF